MSQAVMPRVVGRLRQAIEFEQTPDGALLDAFVGEHSETAFAEIVRRHGPMVWGVCWRLVSTRQDAEDCYQATFLVLVRKANTVRPRSRIGAWLHGVAYTTALHARRQAAKRGQRECVVDHFPEPISDPDSNSDLRQMLDRGLNELPDKYRIPIVLCELEGRTLKDVAAQLERPIGTVAGWLSRGRHLLKRRLAKHGMPAIAISALIADHAYAAPPVASAPMASATARALADATIHTFFFGVLKSWLITTAALITLGCGVGWMYCIAAGDVPPENGVLLRDHEGKIASGVVVGVVEQKKAAKSLITKDAQKAIDAGLDYLDKEQASDGSWGTGQYEGNVAITSLAGLAFLSSNNYPNVAVRTKIVNKAIRFVLNQEDKDTPGYFVGKGANNGNMYNQGFAVLFLADAHGTIMDKKLKADVKTALDRGVKLIVDSQNNAGGWRYYPRPADADLSVSAGQVVALMAARDVGVGVPKATIDKAIAYIKNCQEADDGGFRYQQAGGGSNFARTGAGLTALNRLGLKDGKEVTSGMEYLHKFAPTGDGGVPQAAASSYLYGHYYAAKAMWYGGDKTWSEWYPAIRAELLKKGERGTWTEAQLGPHYGTAMALIILQMPHGRLPSMKR